MKEKGFLLFLLVFIVVAVSGFLNKALASDVTHPERPEPDIVKVFVNKRAISIAVEPVLVRPASTGYIWIKMTADITHLYIIEADGNKETKECLVYVEIHPADKDYKRFSESLCSADLNSLYYGFFAVVKEGMNKINENDFIWLPHEIGWNLTCKWFKKKAGIDIPSVLIIDFDGDGIDEFCVQYVVHKFGPYAYFAVFRTFRTVNAKSKYEEVYDVRVCSVDNEDIGGVWLKENLLSVKHLPKDSWIHEQVSFRKGCLEPVVVRNKFFQKAIKKKNSKEKNEAH